MTDKSEAPQPDLPGFIVGGPFLQAAVLCEKVLREADGVLSVIRIVDRITVTVSGGEAPTEMPPAPVNLIAVLIFKSGFARGSYPVKVRAVTPTNQTVSTVELPMFLEGEDRGANLMVNLAMQASEEGLYWFEVLVADTLVTKMPLRILYQRMSVSP